MRFLGARAGVGAEKVSADRWVALDPGFSEIPFGRVRGMVGGYCASIRYCLSTRYCLMIVLSGLSARAPPSKLALQYRANMAGESMGWISGQP